MTKIETSDFLKYNSGIIIVTYADSYHLSRTFTKGFMSWNKRYYISGDCFYDRSRKKQWQQGQTGKILNMEPIKKLFLSLKITEWSNKIGINNRIERFYNFLKLVLLLRYQSFTDVFCN